MKRIIIQNIDLPRKDLKNDVQWICDSLGLINGRDTNQISFKIFYELLDQFSSDKLISTEDLANNLHLEPPRINHHIRTMMDSGIFLREKRKVALRGGSLTAAIEEMKRDSNLMFNRLLEVSKKIDKAFDLN